MNFGILGYGKMGKIRYDIIAKNPEHTVTKISERRNCRFPEGVEIVTNYQDIINDKNIDAVLICSPNSLIKKYVIKCLDYGKHVFSEKPPGINSTEVLEMMKAEKRNPGLKLMFGFNHRHHESVIRAKRLIDSGKYGKLLWMRGRYGKSVSPDFKEDWRSKRKLAGGGILLDQGIHMLDLFLMMCGDFDEVKAIVSNIYWMSDIEDNVFAIFRNRQGQVASLHSTMTQWRHLFSVEMFLEKGYITINGLLTSSRSYGEEAMTVAINRTEPPSATWTEEEDTIYKIDTSWRTEFDIFINSIINDEEVPVANTRDALKLMRLVDKIYSQK